MLLNCLAHYINRNHAHHDEKVKGTRWRWLTKYFDAKGFFEWEEERVQDIDHTIDSKIDKLTEQVVALTALVSTVPGAAGGVAAIEALGAAKPSERSDSGPAGWSQRMKVAPLRPAASLVAAPVAAAADALHTADEGKGGNDVKLIKGDD